MTFKIKMLTAAAFLAVPAVAGAQATQPQPAAQAQPQTGTTMDNVSQTVRQSQDPAASASQLVQDEQPRQAEETAAQPVQQPPAPASETPPAPAAAQTAETPPAAAQAQAQPAAQGQAGPVTAATSADLVAGAQVRDTAGGMVGTIESADADSAVVSTGAVRADIPIASFGRNGQGLVLAMTRTELETAARNAARTPTS